MLFKDLRLKKYLSITKTLLVLALAGFLLVISPLPAQASIPNHLYRVDIRPKQNYTNITVRFENPPQYELATLPGNRLRLIIKDTGGPLFKKFRRYSDTNIGGLVFSRRGTNFLITFQIASGAGWRDRHQEGISAITLDVGKTFNPGPPQPFIKGREKIWSGVEKLVRDFDPPLKAEIPFIPTDRTILKNILADNDQQAFLAAEAALYKGSLSEAEEAFAQFAGKQAPIKSLALYRLGETLYKLQKYALALQAFREAEKLWPAYLNFNPGVTFCFGDSIARSGDLAAGRNLLGRMISGLADKTYAPALLVRMADILTRQGHEQEALAIYLTVAANHKDSKAGLLARLRLADRDFFRANPWNYHHLSTTYKDISSNGEDLAIREESFFKSVLLECIHGESSEALQQVVKFQKRFPRGIYATVCRTIREVLVAQVYLETAWGDADPAQKTAASFSSAASGAGTSDRPGLMRFVEEHQEYLAGCIEQKEFLPRVVSAYDEAGTPLELIKFLSGLQDRQWAAPGLPFIYEEIADKADLLGDSILAEKTIRSFLAKFSNHSRTRVMMERLGSLYFVDGKPEKARDTLGWLLNKGEHAAKPESYYYLGRSFWSQKQYPQTTKAIDLFLTATSVNDKEQVRRLPDAYFLAASAREANGDRKGALRMVEAGLKLPANARTEEFIYKAGQLNLLGGRKQQARSYFEQNIKNGKDADWRKISQQALDSMNTSRSKN
ncbi:MAG TPA: tetratricopeptide repeat protein [Desulfuromonadaceae bacterium]|jgi:tetratricopeptide (TPR) repeat protein